MTIVTIFPIKIPTIAGFQFDAVFDDNFEAKARITTYPTESGALAADHIHLEPIKVNMKVAVSDSPLKILGTDIAAGVLSNIFKSSAGSFLVGTLSGGLSAGNEGRAAQALEALVALRDSRVAFDLDLGDILLRNMVVVSVSRTKNNRSGNTLFADISLQELPSLDTVLSRSSPKQSQLPDNDPAKNQAAEFLRKGRKVVSEAGASINSKVSNLIKGIVL